jgi:hypothetical protein
MLLPNVSSLFEWTNNFSPAAPAGSEDFLQLIRYSDGKILKFIDETGTPRGSLAVGGSGGIGGVRVLNGAFGTNYVVDSDSWVDVDATNLSTTITVPVGFTLVVTATANLGIGGADDIVLLGLAIDGSIANYINANIDADGGTVSTAIAASLAGDGNPHIVALQGNGSFIIESNNAAGPTFPPDHCAYLRRRSTSRMSARTHARPIPHRQPGVYTPAQ